MYIHTYKMRFKSRQIHQGIRGIDETTGEAHDILQSTPSYSHAVPLGQNILGAFSSLRSLPVDILSRDLNITSLAMDATVPY